MSRLTCAIVLSALLLSATAMLAGQERQNPTRERFSGSTVLAKYVTGSESPELLGLQGCLETEGNHLVFVPLLSTTGDEKSGYHQSRVRRFGRFLAHLASPSYAKPSCEPKSKGDSGANRKSKDIPPTLGIAYDEIRVLARGQVLTTGQTTSASLQGLLAVASVGGLITTLTSLHDGPRITVGAATGTLVIVAAGAYLNRRTNNYIAIFFNSARPTPDLSTTQVESTQRKQPPKSPRRRPRLLSPKRRR